MPDDQLDREFDDTFRGTKVRVHGADHTYEGWTPWWYDRGGTVLLYDVTRADGVESSAVLVSDPAAIERVDADRDIQRVPVEAISPSPYDARTYDGVEHRQFVRNTAKRGHLLTFPVVRVVEDGYEIVSGHRRVDAARRAGLDDLPVEVIELGDWPAARRFVHEHVPLPGEREDRDDEFYADEEIEVAFERLRERWSLARLERLPPLEPEIEAAVERA